MEVLLCCLKGHPLWGLSAVQCWRVEVERGYRDGSIPVCDSEVSPCLHACLLFYTSISHCNLLPQVPSGHLPTVNSRPCPGIALQSLCSNALPLCFLGDLHPCPGYIQLQPGLAMWFSFHSYCHRPAASLSNGLRCFTSVPNSCPDVGIWSLLQFLHSSGSDPVLLTLLFSPLLPSSCQDLHSTISYFLVVRCSWLLSDGILQDLLCLEVYSWCIHGQRYIPHSHTPLSSCIS